MKGRKAVVPPKMKHVSLSGCSLSAVRAHTLSLYIVILSLIFYTLAPIYGYISRVARREIDGTSLTVCNVNNVEGGFDFMLVAYTQQHIVVPKKAPGDKVNIEVDVTAKYVEKSMAALVGRVEELEREVAGLKSK